MNAQQRRHIRNEINTIAGLAKTEIFHAVVKDPPGIAAARKEVRKFDKVNRVYREAQRLKIQKAQSKMEAALLFEDDSKKALTMLAKFKKLIESI